MAHGRIHRREFTLNVVRQVARAARLWRRWRKAYDARGAAACGALEESGSMRPEKGAGAAHGAEHHALIAVVREPYLLAVRRRGVLLGAGRTWSSAHPRAAETAARDTALRAPIEPIILAVPGYG